MDAGPPACMQPRHAAYCLPCKRALSLHLQGLFWITPSGLECHHDRPRAIACCAQGLEIPLQVPVSPSCFRLRDQGRCSSAALRGPKLFESRLHVTRALGREGWPAVKMSCTGAPVPVAKSCQSRKPGAVWQVVRIASTHWGTERKGQATGAEMSIAGPRNNGECSP